MLKDKECVLDFKTPIIYDGVEMMAEVHIPHAVVDYDESLDVPLTIKRWDGGTVVLNNEIETIITNATPEMFASKKEIFTILIPEE